MATFVRDGLLDSGRPQKALPGLSSPVLFQSHCRTANIFHIKDKSKEISSLLRKGELVDRNESQSDSCKKKIEEINF